MLVGAAVVLHLEERVIGAEDLAGVGDRAPGAIGLTVQQLHRELARQAPGQAGEPFGVLGHQLLVHARTVVEALEMGGRDELQQVAVPDLVAREQREVEVLLLALPRVPIEPRPRGDVGLDADDRLDARGSGRLEELQGAEHRSVVGDRHGRHAETRGFAEDRRRPRVRRGRVDARRPVEQGVLGMDVEVDEAVAAIGHLRRADSLRGGYPQRPRKLWRTTPM